MGFYGKQIDYLKGQYPAAHVHINEICKLLFPPGQDDPPWLDLDFDSNMCLWEELEIRVRALLRYIDDCNTACDLHAADSLFKVMDEGANMPFCAYEPAQFAQMLKAREETKREQQARKVESDQALMYALQVHTDLEGTEPPTILEVEDWFKSKQKCVTSGMHNRVHQIVRSVRMK